LFEDKPLISSRKFAAVLLAILAGAAAAAFYLRAQTQGQSANSRQAQIPAASQMDRNLVVLDPAHGGPDAGATLGDKIFEKDVTLAIAARMRAKLTAAGFTVVSTRDADSADPNPLTGDQRAEIANRAHALACIVIHATASGSGLHLYTSALQPPEEDSSSNVPLTPRVAFVPVPWEQAQAASVSQSLRLAGDLSAALGKANLPLLAGREPVRPLDNLQCPAVALELAPLPIAGSDATPVTDADYQQRVAATLTVALQAWRIDVDPTASNSSATGAADSAVAAQAAAQSARASAEAAGRAAVRLAAAKAHAPLGVAAGTHAASQAGSPAGSHGAAYKDKENSAGKAAPASSSSGSGDNPAPAGGSE
jgi:N-acetylmuramoyl-L-alanine amidase